VGPFFNGAKYSLVDAAYGTEAEAGISPTAKR
jgi:hypothetical protein